MLPLDQIVSEIKDNNWIKNIRIYTNYKNTIFIQIEERIPVGIYSFNDNLFFFEINGKIIDEYNSEQKSINSLIIFEGQSSNLEAHKILKILEILNFDNKFKIRTVEYINKRRWNIYLKNNIKLMLSEGFPKTSLENFMKIKKNLSEIDSNNIKSYDLRDISKIIEIKND